MKGLIDMHCHLHDREFFEEAQAEEMLKRAAEKGVNRVVCIGTNHEDSLNARDFASAHDGVFWTYGIHPEFASKSETTMSMPEAAFVDSTPIAIGEVGLDYHYEGFKREDQIHLFEQMLQLARDNDLPLSFHVREAFDDFFPVVANFTGIRGVVHSFSDNKKNLRRILNETDFYVGVNGMATYSTLPTPPLERILLETDAPFLTPKPFRGIINEPAYIPEIANWLAEKLGQDFKIIEEKTTKNAEQLFKFPDSVVRP